jgi:Zn-dependent protease
VILGLLFLIVFSGSGDPRRLLESAQVLAILFPLLILSLTFHEYAHAAVAKALGDDTAERQGRLTLNPIAHLDPLGTVLLVITIMVGFGIGWAKPVPVNPWRLKAGPRAGMGLVAIAGPVMNLLIAFVAIQLFKYLPSGAGDVATEIVQRLAIINVTLAVFNMIPIPPLDGFRVLVGILPERAAESLSQLEQYGPMLLMLLVFLGQGVLSAVIGVFSRPIIQTMLAV